MLHSISERELEVLRLLALGLANKAIAESLNISVKTVENHLRFIYAKLGVCGRAGAVAVSLTKGIIALNDAASDFI